MTKSLRSVTTKEAVHSPGTQRLTQHLKPDASGTMLEVEVNGVMVRSGAAFTFIPWGNVVECAGELLEERGPAAVPGVAKARK